MRAAIAREKARIALSDDKQSLLRAQIGADFSELNDRVNVLENSAKWPPLAVIEHLEKLQNQIDTLNEDQFSLHERVAALERATAGPIEGPGGDVLKRVAALEKINDHTDVNAMLERIAALEILVAGLVNKELDNLERINALEAACEYCLHREDGP